MDSNYSGISRPRLNYSFPVIAVIFLTVLGVIILILFGVFGILTYCRARKGETLHKIICE
eukprot:PDM60595.1 hypothetical protein PRIPAC_53573 [Pristionchus pacificus]